MYPYNNIKGYRPVQGYHVKNDDRFVGGFLGPFLLGGITGGLLAPAFYPRPIYGPIPMNPYPVNYQYGYPNQIVYVNNPY